MLQSHTILDAAKQTQKQIQTAYALQKEKILNCNKDRPQKQNYVVF